MTFNGFEKHVVDRIKLLICGNYQISFFQHFSNQEEKLDHFEVTRAKKDRNEILFAR
jgi:hypothetical protein